MSDTFEIIIDGIVDGEKISPHTIDITLFKDYISDISDIVKKTIDKQRIEEKAFFLIEEGSLKIVVLASAMFINSFNNDVSVLKASGTLNNIDPTYSKVFEKWQKNAKSNDTLNFNFLHNGQSLLRIDKDSDFKTDLSLYVDVEKILYGTITDMGGKNEPNIHLDTEIGNITIYCSKGDITNQDNRLYKPAAIKVRVKQHISTFECLKKYEFLEFYTYSGKLEGESLDNFINQHSKYWENIPDSAEWTRKLRDENNF